VNGYVICPTGEDAFSAFDRPEVRYAASLDNGGGIVAFEGDQGDAYNLSAYGRVLAVVDPDPQPEWWWFLIPKRRIATGSECFYLTKPVHPRIAWENARLFAEDGVTGLAVIVGNSAIGDGEHRVLIEADGPRHWFGLEWFARSVDFRDARLKVPA
jgi:hypothetical protein